MLCLLGYVHDDSPLAAKCLTPVTELYSGVPEPFLPMHIFRNYQYDIITLLAVIGGMVFYANAGQSTVREKLM